MSEAPRVRLSTSTPARGEIVTVRTMATHPMENGLRLGADGAIVPAHIIERFECSLDGELIFAWEPETAVAENPYLEFSFVADASGELRLVWLDDRGARMEAVETVTVTG